MRPMYLAWLLSALLLASCREVTAGPPPSKDTPSACKAAADSRFKKKYPVADEQTPLGSGKATYTSHFSSTKSNCFMEAVQTVHHPKDAVAAEPVDSEIHYLVDVKTGEQVGQLVIFSNQLGLLWCEVDKTKCWNVKEWGNLVDPYMKH